MRASVTDSSLSPCLLTANGERVKVVDWYGFCLMARWSLPSTERLVSYVLVRDGGWNKPNILPRRAGVACSASGKALHFEHGGSGCLAVHDNENLILLLFLEQPPEKRPCLNDPSVVDLRTFGVLPDAPGLQTERIQAALHAVATDEGRKTLLMPTGVYRSGSLHLPSGLNWYFDEGAVLKASDNLEDLTRDPLPGPYGRRVFLSACQARDVTLRGPGILDGNGLVLRAQSGRGRQVQSRFGPVDSERVVNLQFAHCRQVQVQDLYSVNSSSWNIVPYACDNIRFERVKIIGNMQWKNDDGIDPDSCRDLVVSHCFIMARDDAIVLKTCGSVNGALISPDGGSRDMCRIRIARNLLWSGTAAMKYGYNESEAGEVHDVEWTGNDIIQTREGVQLMLASKARVSDFRFHGNHYERCTRQNYRLLAPGVRNISFTDEVHEALGCIDSEVQGERVTFNALRIAGRAISSLEEGRMAGQTGTVLFH